LFSWSLPFLADKIGEMLDHLLNKNTLVGTDKLKIASKSSDKEFSTIMSELEEEKK
jgi:hypothetical protein